MKQKLGHKDEEIASLAKEVQTQKKTAGRFEEINSKLLSELQEYRERRRTMKAVAAQTNAPEKIEHRDKNLQCSLLVET